MTLSNKERFMLMRRRAKLTQEELARVLGVTRNTINRAENGIPVSKRTRERLELWAGRRQQLQRDNHVKTSAPLRATRKVRDNPGLGAEEEPTARSGTER